MNKGLLTFCLILTCGTCLFTGNAVATVITTEVNPLNGHIYHLLDQTNWTDAQNEAISLKGNLVTINDQSENDWLAATFGNFGGIPRAFFIGLNDANVEGQYEWVSGEPVSFINWSIGEPNNFVNGDEDYGMMWQSGIGLDGQWNDFANIDSLSNPNFGTIPMFAVVEVSVPEPGTFLLSLFGAASLLSRRVMGSS